MHVDELIAAARRRAGLHDFGEESWREPLGILVDSWNTEAALNELGVAAMTDLAVGFLVRRLEVEHWYAEHPEIDEQQIVAPLFGLGLPRTGSTATSYLLAQDPARRSLEDLFLDLVRGRHTTFLAAPDQSKAAGHDV